MSGICGVVFNDRTCKVNSEYCVPMLKALGAAIDNDRQVSIASSNAIVGVGLSRRNITGIVSKKIHNKIITLAFYGNIFNQKELRSKEPEDKNILVNLLDLFIEDGTDFLSRLNGEYVLAIFDERHETLLLATDHFRVHPLFYYFNKQQLIFSSSLSGILAFPLLQKPTLNSEAIIDVVTSSVIPTPRTIFNEVEKLSPGSVLTWRSGKIHISKYWDTNFLNPDEREEEYLSKELKEFFANSIRERLSIEGNVEKIGAFLSGGIDSSTVVGVLTHLVKQPIKSFSIGFEEQPFNEVEFARCAANAFGAKHFEFIVRAGEAFPVVPLIAESFDEPYGNASAIPTYFCAKLARDQGVEVLYGGDGGDELFAGNERYTSQRKFDLYQNIPRLIRSGCLEPLVLTLSGLCKNKILEKTKKYIARATTPYPDRLISWGLFEVMPIQEVFTKEFIEEAKFATVSEPAVFRLYKEALARTELDRQLYIDLKLAISDNDIFKVTKMTNIHGVTARFPFLDYRLVDFACRIPAARKMRGSQLRTFFKKTYTDLLPLEILSKPKHGFGLPVAIWLRSNSKFLELMTDLLLSSHALNRGYISKSTIEELMLRHKEDETSFYGSILWNMIMLELWLRRHYDSFGQ